MVPAKFSTQAGELLRLQAGFKLNLKALNEYHREDRCACRMLTVSDLFFPVFMVSTAWDSHQH